MRNLLYAIPAAVLALAAASAAFAADDYMQAIGGPGGGKFVTHCPPGALLHGVELLAADDVDAMRPICVTAQGPVQVIPAPADDTWHGGNNGNVVRALCPDRWPIVIALSIEAEGVDTIIVNTIGLECGIAAPVQPANRPPNTGTGFVGPHYQPTQERYGFGFGSEGARATGTRGAEACPPGHVAVGVHGRSGIWLDAMGLICGDPVTYVPLGRMNTGSAPSGPPMSLCDRARDAQARNSPAAADLMEQCRHSQPPVKSIGRAGHPMGLPDTTTNERLATPMTPVSRAPPTSTTATTPTAAIPARPPICDRARDARARNSPAAPNLEAQCRALGGTP